MHTRSGFVITIHLLCLLSIFLMIRIVCSYDRCSAERDGKVCPYRHLLRCHPERIAYLYMHGLLSTNETILWNLSPFCREHEANPFALVGEKSCYDFTNSRNCKRNKEGKICRFRHLMKCHLEERTNRITGKSSNTSFSDTKFRAKGSNEY